SQKKNQSGLGEVSETNFFSKWRRANNKETMSQEVEEKDSLSSNESNSMNRNESQHIAKRTNTSQTTHVNDSQTKQSRTNSLSSDDELKEIWSCLTKQIKMLQTSNMMDEEIPF